MLDESTYLRVVAEVADGLEAVQKAVELKPRFDFAGHRPAHNKWNRSCSTDSQGFPGIQNSLLKSGIFCRRGRRRTQHGRVGLRRESKRQRSATCCCGSRYLGNAICERRLASFHLRFILNHSPWRLVPSDEHATSNANSAAGTVDCKNPQFKHTTNVGNTKTPGLSRCLRPAKWITISAGNVAASLDLHEGQNIDTPIERMRNAIRAKPLDRVL